MLLSRARVCHGAAAQRHVRARPQLQLACLQGDNNQQQQPNTMVQQQQASSIELPPELAGFRPNVGMCVVDPRKGVFAATRLDDNSRSWQMPQGGIDPGETPRDAALRELLEETSIRSVEVVAECPRWLAYEFPTAVKCRLHGSWAQYNGQAQRWFLLKFTGEDAEVNLDTAHREFGEWRWMPLEQLPDTVIHFKQDVYRQVVAEFKPMVDLLMARAQGQ